MRVAVCLLAACHVTATNEITRPGKIERIPHPEGAIARRPTLVLTDDGRLRFVEPLECPTEEVVADEHAIETKRSPNLATFVVGVIATAVGGILLVRGAADDSTPFLVTGGVSLGVGLPFAIGPWIGNGTELRSTGAPSVRRPGAAQPCGERALAAKEASLSTRGIEVFGAIDRDGYFAVSPYQLVDAFEPVEEAWAIGAKVEASGGARTLDVILDPHAVQQRAQAFLAHADFDTKIQAIQLVPGISAGTLRVSLTQTPDGAAVRIVLAMKNDGPGPAYALRGHVTAPGTPALDGRVMYFGGIAKGGTLSRELLVPVSPAAAGTLRNATIDLTLELRDAHGTAPTTPVRFHGPVLVDAPR